MVLTETLSASRIQTNGLMQPDTLRRVYEDYAHARAALNGATWQQYWFGDGENKSLDGYERSYGAVASFIDRQIPPEMKSGKQPGLGERMDIVMTGIEWHRRRVATHLEQTQDSKGKKDTGPQFSDLMYLGINFEGIETLPGSLLVVVDQYRTLRGLGDIDMNYISSVVEQRKQTVSAVSEIFNSRMHGFIGKNKDAVQDRVITFYAQKPLQERDPEQDADTLEAMLFHTAEERLAASVKTEEAVPLSYQWFEDTKQKVDGLITPSFDTLVRFNKHLIGSEPIDMYCCPNYATERKGDVHVYTFAKLGTGIGLTAERGFPLIDKVIDRSIELQQDGALSHPLQMNIGIADFEVTEDNARLVGLAKEEFEKNLGASVESMVWALTNDTQTAAGREVVIDRINPSEDPIGQWQVAVKQDGKTVAQISFGPLTEIFVGKVEGYKGRETFEQMVAEKRKELRDKAETDERFQRRLANLLKLRLGLMTRWRDGSEPYIVQAIGEMFDEMTESGFTAPLLNHKTLPGLTGQLNEILLSAEYQHGEKDVIVKAKMVKWLEDYATDPEVNTARAFLLKKVAGQGAEYVVMTNLKRQTGGTQIVADSYPMWQVFGDEEEVPVMAVKGGYEGA